jgi:hypothetical protein
VPVPLASLFEGVLGPFRAKFLLQNLELVVEEGERPKLDGGSRPVFQEFFASRVGRNECAMGNSKAAQIGRIVLNEHHAKVRLCPRSLVPSASVAVRWLQPAIETRDLLARNLLVLCWVTVPAMSDSGEHLVIDLLLEHRWVDA